MEIVATGVSETAYDLLQKLDDEHLELWLTDLLESDLQTGDIDLADLVG